MRVIGIIPARMASTRFPGKPLAPIAGKPMLWHVYHAAGGSRFLSSIFVATADKEIIDWCEFFGVKYIITRSDCRNGTERCNDAMRQLAQRDPDDIVINIQCDEPLIRPESLDALAQLFNDPKVEIASLCFAPSGKNYISNPNRVKVLVGEDGKAICFKRIVEDIDWRLYRQHVGIYAYRRDVLRRIAPLEPIGDLEQLALMMMGYKIKMLEIPYATVAIDTPEDIPRAEKLLDTTSIHSI